jgi:hypothetical protein
VALRRGATITPETAKSRKIETFTGLAQRTPAWEEFNNFIGANEATELAKRYRIV